MSVSAERKSILTKTCGLCVRTYMERGVRYFAFAHSGGLDIKTVCTYKKARIFAEGYVAGFRAAQAGAK